MSYAKCACCGEIIINENKFLSEHLHKYGHGAIFYGCTEKGEYLSPQFVEVVR